MKTILFDAGATAWETYEPLFKAAQAEQGTAFDISPDHPKDQVEAMIHAPVDEPQDFTTFPKLRGVFTLWAGVERVLSNPSLNVPLIRMTDTGLKEGMREWVTGHTLRYHLEMDHFLAHQSGVWVQDDFPPLARDRKVGILGFGELGRAAADILLALGFDLAVWSRTAKDNSPCAHFHGPDGLSDILARSEILICLLPQTPDTIELLDATRLAQLPQGARLMNGGRGGLFVEADLLAALDTGQVGHATLDVFNTEPLPADHPYWAHPMVTVTPHVSAVTRPHSAARQIVSDMQLFATGGRPAGWVDTSAGY